MFFTLEQEHLGSHCPSCGLTDTFLSTFTSARYCVNCHQLYDRTDGTRLRKQLKTCLDYRNLSFPEFELIFKEYQNLFYKKIDDTCELFNPSNTDVASGRLIHIN